MQALSFDSTHGHRALLGAQPSRFGEGSSVSYRLLISVEGGLHRGAAFVAPSSRSVLLGQSTDCDLVLMDIGVHDRSVRLFEQQGRPGAEVMAADVRCNGQALPLGILLFDTPQVELQIGGAAVRFELLRRSRQSSSAAVPGLMMSAPSSPPVRMRWATVAMAGLLMVSTLAFLGGAVNAAHSRGGQQLPRTLDSVVEPFNDRGAEIAIVSDGRAEPVLRGFIANSQMLAELDQSLRSAGLRAGLQLRDVHQMADSLTRLARLTGHACEARHLNHGRFECQTGALDAAALARLQSLTGQVPGVVSLNVRMDPAESKSEPAIAVASTAPVPAPAKVGPSGPTRPMLPVIRHVAVGSKESFAYDTDGRKLRVGDVTGGAKVMRIRFEAVELMLDGQRYSVSVTPMLSAGTGSVTR